MLKTDKKEIQEDITKLIEYTKLYERDWGELVQADFLDVLKGLASDDEDASPFLVQDYLDGWYIAGDDARDALTEELEDLEDDDDDDSEEEREQIEDVLDEIDPAALVEYSTVEYHANPAVVKTGDIVGFLETFLTD